MGQSRAAYAVILAVIVLVAVLSLLVLGGGLSDVLSNIPYQL
jgi:hypothetical protein